MSEGPAPADDRHGDVESDTVRVISNLVPDPNTGNPEHAVNYFSDSDSEEWSDDDFEDDEAAQAVFGAGVVGLDEDWSDDAEDWDGDAGSILICVSAVL